MNEERERQILDEMDEINRRLAAFNRPSERTEYSLEQVEEADKLRKRRAKLQDELDELHLT